MINLLDETVKAITESGHHIDQIMFIGSADAVYSCTWDEFCALANQEYHNGFGGAEVANDLIVLFSTGKKLWRAEYDGSEWWEFDKHAAVDYTKPGKPITKLIKDDEDVWGELADLNAGA